MPQVVRVGKFTVMIFVDDHAPAHVHVRFDNSVVRVIISGTGAELDQVDGDAKRSDVRRAVAVVEANLVLCQKAWEDIHG